MLSITLLLQMSVEGRLSSTSSIAQDLPPAPRGEALRLMSLGEPAAVSRLGMLYLQSFDYHGSNALPFKKLDYGRLIAWLEALQQLDPRTQYPLFAASRIYAEVQDPTRQRAMLEFVFRQFQGDPARRWPWLAHAALLAKHRLHDLDLALRYADALERLAPSAAMPIWVRQMRIFILEDMNEFEAARIVIGGLLATGQIQDPAERRFLERRLQVLENRVAAGRR